MSTWSGGVCLVRGGLSGPGGVCLVRGGCLPGPGWGVSAWSQGCLPGPEGGLPGPVGEGGGTQHALRQTPPVNRMTDRCKNITLATTSLRPVIIKSTVTAAGRKKCQADESL